MSKLTITLPEEAVLNFLSSLDYVKDDLKKIDCPDFASSEDDNPTAFDLLFDSEVIRALQECIE